MAGVELGVPSADETLQDLSGADRFEVELGKESFIKQWENCNFIVKTFHEQLPVPSSKPPDTKADLASYPRASFNQVTF